METRLPVVSAITFNEDMKGNVNICKNSRFEPPFGDLGVTHGVHLWLDGKRVCRLLIIMYAFMFCTVPSIVCL